MATDETRAAGNENALPGMRKIGRHDRQCWRAVQCQPRACSSGPVRAVVTRGRRKVAINQAIRISEPVAAIAKDKTVPDSLRARSVQIAGTLGVDASSAMPAPAQ